MHFYKYTNLSIFLIKIYLSRKTIRRNYNSEKPFSICFLRFLVLIPLIVLFCISVKANTGQKMFSIKFSIKDFLGKFDQIRSFLRIWSNLLKKSPMEKFIFLCSETCKIRLVFAISSSTSPVLVVRCADLLSFAQFKNVEDCYF